MQVFAAPAKINRFLHITGRRADGYHNLQSVFQLLDFGDNIGLSPNASGQIKRLGLIANIAEVDDLCVRAAKLLQAHTGCTLGVEISVEKRIPMGGGLGGGSSDAATVLLALNRLWQLNLSRQTLMQLGLQLGADVPVFIFGQSAWAEGVGEQLSAIAMPSTHFVVITPQAHVPTVQIFTHPQLTRNTKPLKIADFLEDALLHELPSKWHNDCETVVFKEFAAVASAFNWLSQFGQARMSGSGASVFVAATSHKHALEILAQKPENLSGFVAASLQQHPLFDYAI